MPNPDNHMDDFPSSPPKAKQASIPKPKPVPASKMSPLMDTLSMHDYKISQSDLNSALGVPNKGGGHVFRQ